MILTDDEQFAARARYLTTQAKDDEVRYVHDDIGYNYRMTNVQAALGVAQLEQLPRYLTIKADNYRRYADNIAGIPGLSLEPVPSFADNNYWMYAVRVDANKYGVDREGLMARLAANRIQSRPLWHPNHLQKPYRDCGSFDIERAIDLHGSTLNIPCSVSLTEADINRVTECLRHA
jgi:dTDP-4-amino-4,6-dideoxygalactose transaminase